MKAALVLGSASCVFADVEQALALGRFDGVIACNDMAARWPGRLDAAVSKHPERWSGWLAARDRRRFPAPDRVISHLEAETHAPAPEVTAYVEFRLPGQTSTGSSGLFALKVALVDLGFDRAVLCGVPMSADRGHFAYGPIWPDAIHYQPAWREALPAIRDRARSLSGWTRDLLGAPTKEWLTA